MASFVPQWTRKRDDPNVFTEFRCRSLKAIVHLYSLTYAGNFRARRFFDNMVTRNISATLMTPLEITGECVARRLLN